MIWTVAFVTQHFKEHGFGVWLLYSGIGCDNGFGVGSGTGSLHHNLQVFGKAFGHSCTQGVTNRCQVLRTMRWLVYWKTTCHSWQWIGRGGACSGDLRMFC